MYDFPQNSVQGLREQREVSRRRHKKMLWQDREVQSIKKRTMKAVKMDLEKIYIYKGYAERKQFVNCQLVLWAMHAYSMQTHCSYHA